jgi:hypothetical protein
MAQTDKVFQIIFCAKCKNMQRVKKCEKWE